MSTRRHFLLLSAATALALAASACAPTEVPAGYGTPTPGISTLDD